MNIEVLINQVLPVAKVAGIVGGILFTLYWLLIFLGYISREAKKKSIEVYYEGILPIYDLVKWVWIFSRKNYLFLNSIKIPLPKRKHHDNDKKHKHKGEKKKKSPYEVLELPDGASVTEIKKAYKSLAQKFHPDRVNHLGDDLKQLANKKFKEINQSYEELKRIKGFK